MALLPPEDRFTEAHSAKEWKQALSECIRRQTAAVILAYKTVPGNASGNYLATTIMDTLSCNPDDGRIYSFCSHSKEQILTICRANDTYRLTKTPKAQGTYFWPEPKMGKQIIVRKNEFDYLLTLRKKRGKTPYIP